MRILKSYGKFGRFEIRDISYIGDKPSSRPKYEYDLVCWDKDNSNCWSIATLWYNEKEPCFELTSVGLRYLEYSTEALNKWLLQWCVLKEMEINAE